MQKLKRTTAFLVCIAILQLGSPMVAQAELIGTLQAVESAARADDLATVQSTLASADVREQFVALGVDPAKVEARLAALTDTELQALATQMQDMPAGGDALAVIGIVFLVLLILEAVGVIDIFKKFP
jgi:hypothetical protein